VNLEPLFPALSDAFFRGAYWEIISERTAHITSNIPFEPAPLDIRLRAGFHRLGQIVADAVTLFVNSLAQVGIEWALLCSQHVNTRAEALQTRT
jgi:hypothetical protein